MEDIHTYMSRFGGLAWLLVSFYSEQFAIIVFSKSVYLYATICSHYGINTLVLNEVLLSNILDGPTISSICNQTYNVEWFFVHDWMCNIKLGDML